MLRLRSFDQPDRRAYLDEIRPRFLVLRVRADKVNIAWGMPLWAAEELAAFTLGAAALLHAALPLLPAPWRERLRGGVRVGGREFDFGLSAPAASDRPGTALANVYHLVDGFAGGSLRDVLRLPPGEPFVKVAAKGTFVEIAAH